MESAKKLKGYGLCMLVLVSLLGGAQVLEFQSVGAQPLNLPLTTGITGNAIAIPRSSLTSCTTTNPNLSCLTVTKVVNNLNNVATGLLNNIQFHIIVTDQGVNVADDTLSNGQSFSVPLAIGDQFSVTEIDTPAAFITSASGTCSGTVSNNNALFCTIINSPTGSGNTITANPQSAFTPSQNDVRTPSVATPQSAISPGGSSTQASGFGRAINPPFSNCNGNSVPTATTNGVPTADSINRLPSSATYLIKGVLSSSKLQSALDAVGTKTITIAIASDLQPVDGNMLAIANPQFFGKIIVTSTDGLNIKQRTVDFNIQDVNTECHYITLARAAGSATNKNVAPLGEISGSKSTNLKAPDIDKLLVGGSIVTSSLRNLGVASVLNPPFATCTTNQTGAFSNFFAGTNSGRVPDNFGFYLLRGELTGPVKVSGNTFVIEITSDIVPRDDDLAKIVNNNNPYLKVNLLGLKSLDSATRIPFRLDDLWTDCKQVSLFTKSIFQPIISDLNP
jgi:hypothetical protein